MRKSRLRLKDTKLVYVSIGMRFNIPTLFGQIYYDFFGSLGNWVHVLGLCGNIWDTFRLLYAETML